MRQLPTGCNPGETEASTAQEKSKRARDQQQSNQFEPLPQPPRCGGAHGRRRAAPKNCRLALLGWAYGAKGRLVDYLGHTLTRGIAATREVEEMGKEHGDFAHRADEGRLHG
jgi:hypothetical protein